MYNQFPHPLLGRGLGRLTLFEMKKIEKEAKHLNEEVLEMWTLVDQQIHHAMEALLKNDKDQAYSVVCRERKVNAYELKIDSDCEDIIALYAPVAIDLRYVLSIFKINTNLERLGDFAESIARSVMNLPDDMVISENIILASRLEEMCQQVFSMLALAREALEKEDVDVAQQVIAKDNLVDEINKQALGIVAAYLEKHPKEAYLCLVLISIIRKLERFGDHCTNIAEEIIFYLEAKVVKHSEKKYEGRGE